MRVVAVLTSMLLIAIPPVISGQGKTTSGTGHYEGVLSVSPWGQEAKSFDIRAGGNRMEANVAVSPNGVGWLYKQSTFPPTLTRWEDLTSWCTQSGTDVMITFRGHPTSFGLYGFKLEDFATAIKYFKQYAPKAEIVDQGQGCPRVVYPPR
jgi:hypothetical protein